METTELHNLDPMRIMAQLLLHKDYTEILALERQQLESMGLMESARALRNKAPPSTYALQGRGKDRQAERHAEAELRAQEVAATALRQNNMRAHTFSVCARSISKLLRRVPVKDWNEATARRE